MAMENVNSANNNCKGSWVLCLYLPLLFLTKAPHTAYDSNITTYSLRYIEQEKHYVAPFLYHYVIWTFTRFIKQEKPLQPLSSPLSIWREVDVSGSWLKKRVRQWVVLGKRLLKSALRWGRMPRAVYSPNFSGIDCVVLVGIYLVLRRK